MTRFIFSCALVLAINAAYSQSSTYNSFGIRVGIATSEMPGFHAAIDSVNARTTWAGDYQHFHRYGAYGISYVHKDRFYELGGNLLWGSSEEFYVDGDDPSDQQSQIYTYYIRQRMLSADFRAGLCLGDAVSFGAELGGVLSNFQSDKKKDNLAPLWVINFSGQRSVAGSLTGYIAFHLHGESLYFELQPYYSLLLGQMAFGNAFDRSIIGTYSGIPATTTARFLGVRLMIGLCKEK